MASKIYLSEPQKKLKKAYVKAKLAGELDNSINEKVPGEAPVPPTPQPKKKAKAKVAISKV